MVFQIALGTVVTLGSVVFGAMMWWALTQVIERMGPWIAHPVTAWKTIGAICVVVIWTMAIMTFGVWLWGGVFTQLAVFSTMEEAVYYSLVAYTTLGLGDVVVPYEYRLLGGMTGANGFLMFGLMTAMLTDAVRDIRRFRKGGD